jgi:glycosyltransferase involved in cell wall biosynthesis
MRRFQPVYDLLRILSRSRRYDVVITANLRTAQLYGFFRKIFRVRWPKQIVLELMLDEAKDKARWKLKRKLQESAFSSVDLIFVSSRSEIEAYAGRLGIPKARFRFLPFHTNIPEPMKVQESDGHVLSPGKAGRDHATLARAIKDLEQEVIVVSDRESVREVAFPENTKVLCDIPYSDYLELLRRCKVVVVPLKAAVRSTGQVVILEAMALGKAVVATEVTGTLDYIRSGVNGLLVPPGDSKALREALLRLTHESAFYDQITTHALESIRSDHTFERYAENILKAASELLETAPPKGTRVTR